MVYLDYGKSVRRSIQNGVNKVADAVTVTLGAKGRNVTIERQLVFGPTNIRTPHITKDGVTVVNSINELPDKMENLGALMVKDASQRTMKFAGDGTTTAALLTQAIFNKGLEYIEAGANPMDLKKGIDKAVLLAVESIYEQAIPITDKSMLQIATVSSNYDTEIANAVCETFKQIGKDGIVTYAHNTRTGISVELSSGLKIDRGYISPYFVNNQKTSEVELKNVQILIFDKKISKLLDILPLLEFISRNNASLLIIAEEVDGEALGTMTTNVIKSGAPWAVIRLPFGGPDVLEDVAVSVGATVMSEKKGHSWPALATNRYEWLGMADSVTISVGETRIVGGKGKEKAISDRISNLREQFENSTNEYDKPFLQKRLASMTNNAATIHIGGMSDTEVGERKDRVDDAVHAVRAAMEEGIVPGGGIVFINAANATTAKIGNGAVTDEGKGYNIIHTSLVAPQKQILLNAGIDYDNLISVSQNDCMGGPYVGYNVKTERWEDFIKTGIIDPAKVSRVALENAASVAGMLLTTECAIVSL